MDLRYLFIAKTFLRQYYDELKAALLLIKSKKQAKKVVVMNSKLRQFVNNVIGTEEECDDCTAE